MPFPLLRPLAAAAVTVAMAAGDDVAPTDAPVDPPVDERTAALLRILRPPGEVKIHPAAESLQPGTAIVRVSLVEHRLRVFAGTDLAIESPIAHGRATSATAEGEFTITEKLTDPKNLNYGHFRTPQGAIVLRGVFARLDPLPPDAVFDPVIPNYAFKLSGDGPLLFAGEATGAATSDGSIVVPEKVAAVLYETVGPGAKVIIGK